jgi:hypothetical protein
MHFGQGSKTVYWEDDCHDENLQVDEYFAKGV